MNRENWVEYCVSHKKLSTSLLNFPFKPQIVNRYFVSSRALVVYRKEALVLVFSRIMPTRFTSPKTMKKKLEQPILLATAMQYATFMEHWSQEVARGGKKYSVSRQMLQLGASGKRTSPASLDAVKNICECSSIVFDGERSYYTHSKKLYRPQWRMGSWHSVNTVNWAIS